MNESVIIHGSENFIGSRLAATLENEGWAQVRVIRDGDVDTLRRELPHAQAVAHCAAGNATHIERSATSFYGLLSAMKVSPRVVHLSSMTVYGSQSGVVDESGTLLADLGRYSMAQLRAEQMAAQCSRAVILRSGVEYGPTCAAWSERVALWLHAHRLGDLGESGDGICNLVYIDDLTSVISTALRKPAIEGGVFNVAMDDKCSWNDYFVAFALALGAVPVSRISRRQLRLETGMAPALKAAELFVTATRLPGLRIPPPIPQSLLRLCRQEIVLSGGRAETVLDARWTPLSQGLSRTAEHYHRNQRAIEMH